MQSVEIQRRVRRAGSNGLAVRSHTSIIETSADHEAARRGSIEDGGDLGKNGKKQMAQDDLDVAWRLAWRDTQHPHFAEMLSNITNAQLAAGFILQAFDTAARIPEEPTGLTDNRAAFIDAIVTA